MILEDVRTYMAGDGALNALLANNSTDRKMYPDLAPAGAAAPFVVYASANPGGSPDEILKGEEFQVSAFAPTRSAAVAIMRRIVQLLDLQDQIAIPSSTYIIKTCRQIPGGGDQFEEETKLYHVAALFAAKYIRP